METQEELNYYRIAEAIDFLKLNFKSQPDLETVAAHMNMSPFHFQRMFKEWAGVTPKQFLQYLSVNHAKLMLREQQSTLFQTAHETGLSGTGRLHDLFIKIEGMTPGEYQKGGVALEISFNFIPSPFGKLMVASTGKGICYMAFADDGEEGALVELKRQFPAAGYKFGEDEFQKAAGSIFMRDWSKIKELRLHLKGTSFQLNVWQTLLSVPMGRLTTYAKLATEVGSPKACRAIGSAVAGNPVAVLIPCHRVIRSTGEIGQYHWGSKRKSAMIGWEASKI